MGTRGGLWPAIPSRGRYGDAQSKRLLCPLPTCRWPRRQDVHRGYGRGEHGPLHLCMPERRSGGIAGHTKICHKQEHDHSRERHGLNVVPTQFSQPPFFQKEWPPSTEKGNSLQCWTTVVPLQG